MEEKRGFTSSFNFVPKKYHVDQLTLEFLRSRGFEVGVHGWKHDGKLYSSRAKFQRRAQKINRCLKDWNATGFRSPAMHHNLDWLHQLDIDYDLSTFDTDPFEPQPDGVCTIFPFWVAGPKAGAGYVEMPYTLPQDSTMFVLMGEGISTYGSGNCAGSRISGEWRWSTPIPITWASTGEKGCGRIRPLPV